MWESKQDQNKNEDHNWVSIEDMPENQKDMGINFMDNVRNNMFKNFKSTKWLFNNLEEIRAKVVKMERVKDVPWLDNQMDQGERLKTAERRINELENFNQIMENNMMSILNSMNDNIQTLTDVLEARGELEKISGVKSETADQKEKDAKGSIQEQGKEMSEVQQAEENQEDLEAMQTMKELDKEKEG